YLIKFFENIGAQVDTMMFVHIDKSTGQEISMTNIIARFNGLSGEEGPRYLIGAHYDTRPRAEYDPDPSKREMFIDGANDGASGVAVLMELGNIFAEQKPRGNFDLVMFDGEDYGPPGHLEEYFLGARDIVRRGIKDKYKFALVIDMIADKNLNIYREAFSNKYSRELTDKIWATAGELSVENFIDSVGHEIHDDHLSFMTIKLPAAVIIDFDYPYWHTTFDTIDKCSAESLMSVGKVVTTFLYRL
ncbi:MAG: M28 family peptidase, partial [Candidatus Zixiibacteriota bacterium]